MTKFDFIMETCYNMPRLEGDIMGVVNISKKRFDSLDPFVLPKYVTSTECALFNFRYRGKDMLLKRLFRNDDLSFANKLYTLQAISINSAHIPDNFITAEFLISINKQIEAFVMPLVKGVNLSLILSDFNFTLSEKKYYLKLVGQVLEQMRSIRKYTDLNDFYLGDLHEDNIIVDPFKKKIYIADLDSCKIAGNRSFPARYLTSGGLLSNANGKYKKTVDKNGVFLNYEVDYNTDLYCYCIMILNFLYGEKINSLDIAEFYNYLNYLDYLKINSQLLEVFNKIVLNCDNLSPLDYIDTLTSEQILRARKKVYMCNK